MNDAKRLALYDAIEAALRQRSPHECEHDRVCIRSAVGEAVDRVEDVQIAGDVTILTLEQKLASAVRERDELLPWRGLHDTLKSSTLRIVEERDAAVTRALSWARMAGRAHRDLSRWGHVAGCLCHESGGCSPLESGPDCQGHRDSRCAPR